MVIVGTECIQDGTPFSIHYASGGVPALPSVVEGDCARVAFAVAACLPRASPVRFLPACTDGRLRGGVRLVRPPRCGDEQNALSPAFALRPPRFSAVIFAFAGAADSSLEAAEVL